jgi:phosphatidate cytidylyltransferase
MLVVYQIIGSLFILLTFASGAAYYFGSKQTLQDLRPRIISWWVILPVFSLALIVNGDAFFILLCFISFMGFKEFISAIPTRLGDRSLIFILYLAIPAQFYLAWTHNAEFAHFFSLSLFLFIALMAVLFGETKGMLVSVAVLYWGFVLSVNCLSFIAYLNTLPPSTLSPIGGMALVLYLVVLTQLNDVAQYCWGKFLGSKKIIPHVSPNKTISGFLGGIVTTALLSLLLGNFLISLTMIQTLVAGVLIAVSGFLGDILISGIKRDLGIKDFSRLIPAHGGMLDRIDSLILSAPLFFYFLKFYHFGVQ